MTLLTPGILNALRFCAAHPPPRKDWSTGLGADIRGIRMLTFIQTIAGTPLAGASSERLGPCEGKLSRTVLRGVSGWPPKLVRCSNTHSMKQFLKAWARGVSISAFFFCLSIVVAALGGIAEFLPPEVSLPVCIVFGPPAIYWVSSWLAPDLFPADRPWWRGRFNRRAG